MTRPRLVLAVAATAVVVGAAGCGSAEPLTFDEASARLDDQLERVDPVEDFETRAASVALEGSDLADTLPPIDEFPVVVEAPRGTDVVAEVYASTEKSGEDTDGWLVEVAQDLNDSRPTLADGRSAGVVVRSIPSGTAYSYIAAGRDLPDGYTPSSSLWGEMAAVQAPVTTVSEQLVPNVAGVVMRTETADEIRSAGGEVAVASLIEAVIAGDVVMGYTDPFVSTTGLNFLVTVLDSFADGDESRFLDDDVASVFEQFQQRVPFVALSTLQLRESVQREGGTLDAFVMEYQTFVQTESLRDGYEFVPFGVRHDNPLYAVGDPDPAVVETLELLAEASAGDAARGLADEYGFTPPEYEASFDVPAGETLVGAQQLWKDKKDGGRPLAAVFVTDVSGSMAGTRIQALQRAMLSAAGFVRPDARVGLVEFDDTVTQRLPVAEFDLNQQARFVASVEAMEAAGGTAMYDGILVGLDMLLAERAADPDTRILLIVLTDGETQDGYELSDVDRTIEGLGIPVYTVGFEADLEELDQVSALVEAASIDASEEDVEFQLSALFNAGI